METIGRAQGRFRAGAFSTGLEIRIGLWGLSLSLSLSASCTSNQMLL